MTDDGGWRMEDGGWMMDDENDDRRSILMVDDDE